MGSSDSDTESDCFESAEESFDEEEQKCEKSKFKKNQRKSENEDSKPVVSDCSAEDSEQLVEGNSSNSSLSYRKRPERVKRLLSKTQTKPNPKLPMKEILCKTDKIVPDVFLLDITSNLSKNLNKSLSTLQQKSSNVKDLILNSLPVSSVNDNEGFSYDDKNTSFPEEDTTPRSEAKHENSKQSIESQECIIEENNEKEKEIFIGETSNGESDLLLMNNESESNDKKVPENIENFEKDFCTENIATADTADNYEIEALNFNEENSEKCSSGFSALDSLETSAGNICKETLEIVSSKKEEIQDIKDVLLGQKTDEVLDEDEGNNTNANNIKSSDYEETNEESIVNEENNLLKESNVNLEVERKEDTFEEKAEPGELDFGNSNNNVDLINSDENTNNNNQTKEIIDTECNFTKLKIALNNIVSNENLSMEEKENSEDKEEVKKSSGDGWDDFDFSDNEFENSNTTKVNESYGGKELENIDGANDKLTNSNLPVLDKNFSECETELETNQSKTVIENRKNLNKMKTTTKGLVKKPHVTKRHEVKKENKEMENPKNLLKCNIDENDSWDWDSWDEIPENKEAKVIPFENSKVGKNENNLSDVGKWSGWDTFGQKSQEKQDNWSLGSWGVDALLNKATAVTQGISSVLEAGLGAPDPETLARMEKIEREISVENVTNIENYENECPEEISKKNSLTNINIFPVSGITSLVAGVTSKIVEHSKIQEIGSKVITGGLETLETFGKKTMEVLQEGDPGLKNKRALLLGNNKPILSQVLKEAREKADRESKKAEEKELAKKCHFETLFDDFQGMVHLEALEMLSRQCELKLDQIRSGMNSEEQEDLNGILEEVDQLCSLDEYDIDMKSSVLDFKTLLQMAVEPLKNEISVQNIVQIHEDVCKWLQTSSETETSFTVINQKLVSTLAQLTAATVHQFHKSGELLSVKECRKTVEEVDALSRLTNALCTEINKLGEKFLKLSCNQISKDRSDDVNCINEKVNSVMENSTFYIKQAFNLLIPVIQLGAAA